MIVAALAGAVAIGGLGGAALAGQSGSVAQEWPAADTAAAEAVALVGDQTGPTGSNGPGARSGVRAQDDRPRARLALRRGLAGVHGEATVRTRGGGYATYTWQRGDVTAVSAGSISVRSADGTSWTWTVTGDTKVRKNGAKSTSSALASGDHVFVLGQPGGGTRTAQGVVAPRRTKD
ncbi:hypothetical protein Sme01_71380 [Sphaerisporangium melleum]|uniref:DUF5666 domain-containing protein n=1 Tax=Sphaerisporangium melleum TaxID=321316 RepID=A0A917RNX5_9ACTN|nr:hypothetical protein GCM10007964_68360 [Sphaerisporangium melleum]GII74662.1 hypothetical protein Sme01_71380 [Sphaerisporangium melleum]